MKGAPIQVTKAHLEASGHTAKAVIANSKNANTCNADGVEKAQRMCELAAAELSIDPNEVIVASTGVIGQVLPIEPIESHIKELAKGLSADGNDKAVNAIMTTDTVPKQYAVKFMLGDSECTVGGMAKGSGMIHPNMATTLNFITSDVAISSEVYYSEKSLGPQRKYYKIVEKGELYLKENIASWNEIVRIFHELEIM